MSLQDVVKTAVEASSDKPACHLGAHYYSEVTDLPLTLRCNHCFKKVVIPPDIYNYVLWHKASTRSRLAKRKDELGY